MPCSRRVDAAPLRASAHAVLVLLMLATLAFAYVPSAHADVVPVESAELRVDDQDLLLSADFDLTLTPALEEALQKGIPLYFTTEFELVRTRWYWLDEKVAQWSGTYRVSYNAITQQYRVGSGPLGQAFDSLAEVLRFVGRVPNRQVAQVDVLVKGARYEAAVRLRLDANQLPKPFQLNALASREWQLSSDWYRWSFTYSP